jgi:osmotically-inducible protein OsmY
MTDREWRRDRDDDRERSQFLDDRDYDRRTYDDRSYDSRDYDDRPNTGYGEHHRDGPGVAGRVREWWHRNVTDAGDDRTYDRDYSHGPISAGHSGWVRDREWENRTIAGDTRYTDRDWRTDNYTRGTGVSTYGTTSSYSGGLYNSAATERGRYTGRGPKTWRRSDERIREDVNEELTRHPDVDAWEVEVAVINGEVTLTGTVDGRQEKRDAEECAWRVSGVKDVHNQLRIKQGVGSVIASVFDEDRR